MPHIASPRKVFQFQVEINGVNQWEVQKVEFPKPVVEKTAHGDTNYDVNTPGRVKLSDLKLEGLKPLPGSDRWAWDWFTAGADPFTGGGVLPGNLKRMVVIREMDTTGTIITNSWVFEGCFVTEYDQSAFDRNSSDNILKTVTLAVDRIGHL